MRLRKRNGTAQEKYGFTIGTCSRLRNRGPKVRIAIQPETVLCYFNPGNRFPMKTLPRHSSILIAGVALLLTSAWPAASAKETNPKNAASQIDPRYTAAGLRRAFTTLCKKRDYP